MSSSEALLEERPPVAPAAPAAPSLRADAASLAERLRAAVAADDARDLDFGTLQDLVAAMCAFYAADAETRGTLTPINTLSTASPTAVLMTTTALLRGANLELFELGMWQTWSGMK